MATSRPSISSKLSSSSRRLARAGARTGESAQQRLKMLQEKHSDRSRHLPYPQKAQSLKAFTELSKEARKEESGQSFTTSWDALTPTSHQRVLQKLHSFFFLMLSLFFVWLGYRTFFQLPVWFDEGVAKALIFGVPVVFFASNSRFVANEMGVNQEQLFPGLFIGLAVGGLYGFAGLFLEVLGGREIIAAPYFLTSQFWWFAFLALLTAWWESLFFFGLPVQYIRSIAPWFSESLLGVLVVGMFLLFHIPLRVVVAGWSPQMIISLGILALFAAGQFIFYLRTKNLYSLVLSHALWGMVIELYSR